MAAFQRFGNPPLCVNDFVEIFLLPTEKLGVGKIIKGLDRPKGIHYIGVILR